MFIHKSLHVFQKPLQLRRVRVTILDWLIQSYRLAPTPLRPVVQRLTHHSDNLFTKRFAVQKQTQWWSTTSDRLKCASNPRSHIISQHLNIIASVYPNKMVSYNNIQRYLPFTSIRYSTNQLQYTTVHVVQWLIRTARQHLHIINYPLHTHHLDNQRVPAYAGTRFLLLVLCCPRKSLRPLKRGVKNLRTVHQLAEDTLIVQRILTH